MAMTRQMWPAGGSPPENDEPPYRNARGVACDIGPAGELIEIVYRA